MLSDLLYYNQYTIPCQLCFMVINVKHQLLIVYSPILATARLRISRTCTYIFQTKQECLFQGHEQCLFLFWHVSRTPLSFKGNIYWNEVLVHYFRWHLCTYIFRFTWCYPFQAQDGQIEMNIFILWRMKIHFWLMNDVEVK